MNKVILMGRLTKDPDVRYSQGEKSTAIARFTLAVDRRIRREGEANTDFINCVSFGKQGEFAEKYLRKGMKICISGRIQTGSYTNKEGQKVYTTDVVVEEQDFCEKRDNAEQSGKQSGYTNAPQQGGYNQASQGGYQQAPQQNNYSNVPRQDGYNQAPQGGYQQAPQQNNYSNVPQQGGYNQAPQGYYQPAAGNGFMNIPDGLEEELPFR